MRSLDSIARGSSRSGAIPPGEREVEREEGEGLQRRAEDAAHGPGRNVSNSRRLAVAFFFFPMLAACDWA